MKNTLHFTFFRTLLVVAFGLFFNLSWGQYSGIGNFQKITSTNDLTDGYYVIATASETFAMNNTYNGTFFAHTPINPVQNQISNPSVNIVWRIESNADGRTIYNLQSNAYVSYSGSSNNVQALTSVSTNNQRWNFTYVSNEFLIANLGVTNRYLKYNSSSPRFACYTSGQNNLSLYKLSAPVAVPPVVTPETLVGTYNTTFNHQVVASGVPTSYTITSGTLPTGIVLDGVTGILSGTPTVVGNFAVQISATNGFGAGSAAQIDFNIQKANQTVSIADQSVLLGAPAASLPAATVEGLAINYTSSNNNVTTVSGTLLTYGQVGNSIITATAGENEFYNSFTTTFNVTVVDPNETPCFEEDFETSNPLNNWVTGGGNGVTTGVNSSNTYMNFNNNGEFAVIPVENIRKIVFGLAGSSGTNSWTLKVQVSQNGNEWTDFTTFAGSSINTSFGEKIVDNINSKYIRFFLDRTGNSSYIDDLSVFCMPAPVETSTTWNGAAWSNVDGPSATLDAIIAGDYNTATNGIFTAKSLTVNSGVFTIASGTSVTVENAVTSAGATNFIVKNNANLIQTSSAANAGAITVERESAQLVRLDHTLWSSPVASQNLYAFSPNTLTNRFYTYATATNNYVNTGLSATTDFIVGKGYGVRAPNDHSTTPVTWTGSFKGVPNNGDVSFTLSTAGQGFNLVGNPYPSVVDGAAFVAANSTKINGTLYFYAHTLTMNTQGAFPAGTNYALWNATGQTAATTGTSGVPALVPNGKIQVGQGFLVKSTALGGDIMFNNAMREANTGNQFFRLAPVAQSTSEVEKHRLWLNLTNAEGTTFNQILIGYVAGATQEIDNLYDGLSFGNEGSALSSRLSNEDYTIQGRALPFNAADVVPLGFKAMTPGNYTISLSDRDGVFAADQNVFLKDNANGSINNIKTAPYTFTAQAGTFNNRFEVVYQSTLSTPESTFNSSSVVAYVKEAQLNIQTKGNSMKAVSVYDVRGRLLFSKSEINATDFVAQGLTTQNQVLLVHVTAENGEVATVKVIF